MKREWMAIADCRELDNTEIIDKICEIRGIEDLSEFLHPTEDDMIPLDKLQGIDNAYKAVENAIDNNSHIVILADTDCDGITSGAIMYHYLHNFTNNIEVVINKGKKHGVEDLETDADLLVVVDSINKADEYRKFTDKGTQVVVLDHHILPDEYEAYSHIFLVSSAYKYPNPELSGAGVVWKFCKYLDEMFLTDYADEIVDLAACGIVADMMDMSVPENRYIVYEGLTHPNNLGIKSIVGTYKFDSQSITFSIASMVNACNRMNQNELALRAFLTDDENEVKQLVKDMKEVKEQQNELVAQLMPELTEKAEQQLDRKMMIFIIDTEYGIAGLLANKLMDIYKRPILILKHDEDGYAGSMRACGIDNFALMVNETGLAECEGHELAAGIFISDENYADFVESIDKKLSSVEFEERVVADVQLDIEQINTQLIDNVKALDFVSGSKGFKPVTVMITDINDFESSSMSQGKHLKLITDNCLVIKWNDCPDLSCKAVDVIGGLNGGRFGRNYFNQVIINEYKVRE